MYNLCQFCDKGKKIEIHSDGLLIDYGIKCSIDGNCYSNEKKNYPEFCDYVDFKQSLKNSNSEGLIWGFTLGVFLSCIYFTILYYFGIIIIK